MVRSSSNITPGWPLIHDIEKIGKDLSSSTFADEQWLLQIVDKTINTIVIYFLKVRVGPEVRFF